MTTWTYPAVVVRVIDGDTFVAHLDMGLGHWAHDQRIRLLGVDCPEMSTQAGKLAKHFTADLLPVGTSVTVISRQWDNFGRILGTVILADGQHLSNLLVNAGHAKVSAK